MVSLVREITKKRIWVLPLSLALSAVTVTGHGSCMVGDHRLLHLKQER